MLLMFSKGRERWNTQRTPSPHWNAEVGVLRSSAFRIGNLIKRGRNHEEKMKCFESQRRPQARQQPKTHTPREAPPLEDQSEHTDWPSPSPDMNPSENLWGELRSTPEDHQFWRILRDSPQKNGLGLHRRHARGLMKTTTNDPAHRKAELFVFNKFVCLQSKVK